MGFLRTGGVGGVSFSPMEVENGGIPLKSNDPTWRDLFLTSMIKGLGWWFQIFCIFTPILREDEPNLTCAYFSKGLVQPPTRGGCSDP